MDFHSVVVNGQQFGDIKADASTAYQPMSRAYRYASVSLSTDSGPLVLRPIDYVGERELGAGKYTYALTVSDGNLRIECVVE